MVNLYQQILSSYLQSNIFHFNINKAACFSLVWIILFPFLFHSEAMAQEVHYNLAELVSKSDLIMENRTVSSLPDKKSVRISAAEGSGVAWLKDVAFSTGTIEVYLRGKDINQESFIGIAFHAVAKDSCEVVYFRPFNFNSKDSLQQAHMVQYIYPPKYSWEYLRETFPGVYEKKIQKAPNPNGWFHVKIEVRKDMISVYVNNSSKPCLEVQPLNSDKNGKIGLWVGTSSDGDYANLKIQSK